MKKISFLFLIIISNSLLAQDNEQLIEVFKQLDSLEKVYEPDLPVDQHYPIFSESELLEASSQMEEVLMTLKAIDSRDLSRQDQITKSTLELKLKDDISYTKYQVYLMPFNAEGGFYDNIGFSIGRKQFSDVEDYENYKKWVRSYLVFLDYNISLLEKGMKVDVMRPKVIVQNALKHLESWTNSAFEEHTFYQPYLQLPNSIDEEDQLRIRREGAELVSKEVIPKYRELKAFFESEYLPKSPDVVGVSGIRNGKEYYEDRIEFYTTQQMSPDSVFNLGLSEVKRIRALMDQIIVDLEFDGNFEDFITFLRTDPQFYAKTPQELLSRAAWLSKKAEGKLPKLFSQLYELPFTVEPVPAKIAPTYTGGRYVPGNRAADRAGIYWVNTYDLPSRPFYTLPALTLHEAVPGHHLGIMVAAELTADIPDFRKNYYISAYGEGWGLYAEYLGEEMGMYETPYDLFGRYTYEMWRACRLVVDVGMHYKGWDRQRAFDFLSGNTALSIHEVNTEIDRYIGWPGQAVSYKIGELTIKSLRDVATKQLGDEFDIQKFHQVILANGSIPLFELQNEVQLFIEKQK
ncbi:MAG: DUF885 domain-containing protein [Flammeovirgaceae bacterium]|nr:DUF885 domain-containing protein [Flammeovirgaceae bacterium]MBE63651.1 DUF885 domain-containing protein [Flammeovirgaceae bacterium]